ncbi:benzoate 4-monooxygenase cytochrome P450 [Penicillium argentinense]|uniref:Benzoate 4-monooxygenase cytochrome P450 n=1 Tax=Penicillium argentinense TaxID=1131581 RepID=A0A9W9K346_9EURO|nr:benzoate 4-monooxygenase cytochrome P450 [Penicillium argentinense]KAJ5091020.1 benzoate 4-monooxygenase cytochrome P450 [Penicillium argentinense]
MGIVDMNYLSLASIILTFCAAYTISLVIYRLVLSPLANFPGPKLAAATTWYETFYDVFLNGRFLWEIERMHQEYGPVVRINPHEIHIHDVKYYTTIYAGPTKKRSKYPWFLSVGVPHSTFSTAEYHGHRTRRAALAPLLTKQAVRGYEPVIQEKLSYLCRHLDQAICSDAVVELHMCFLSFAVDVVSHIVFGSFMCFDLLKSQSLDSRWKAGIKGPFARFLLTRHFPFAMTLYRFSPLWLSGLVDPVCKDGAFIENVSGPLNLDVYLEAPTPEIEKRFTRFFHDCESEVNDRPSNTGILRDLLENSAGIPERQRRLRALDDVKFLMIAGTDAPSQVLAITVFHILRNDSCCHKLQKELDDALPNPYYNPPLKMLEALPFLSAIIREGLRISSVVTSRLPRIAPTEVLTYEGWSIPPGIPVSMSTYLIHNDPVIFPEPSKFQPERWMPDSNGACLYNGPMPFSKGSQACLGPSMTYCWCYLALATMFRRYDMILFETSEENVKTMRDCFNAQTKPGYDRIQIKVLGRRK